MLYRSRSADPLPELQIQAVGNALKMRFPPEWLAAHPLTRADLKQEREALAKQGVKLVVTSSAHGTEHD